MQDTLDAVKTLTIQWAEDYGYHAVIPALLVDPAGVPWAWIFLMLLAGEAGKNIPLMLGYGFLILNVSDYLLYWIGIKGGRPLVYKLENRWPKVGECVRQAENIVSGRGVWIIAVGRYLPLIGRYTGIAAGVAGVPFARFALFNAIGVALTVFGFGLLAHAVGRNTIDSPFFAPVVGLLFIGGTVFSTAYLGWRIVKNRSGSQPPAVDTVQK